MKQRNGWIAGLIVLVSIAGFLLDYGLKSLKQYNSTHFNILGTISSLILINLLFAAILVLVAIQIRKGQFSPLWSLIMILVGLAMMVQPISSIRIFNLHVPYGTYESITGGMWIVVGGMDLLGRKKKDGDLVVTHDEVFIVYDINLTKLIRLYFLP